jgi:hypothetical protein
MMSKATASVANVRTPLVVEEADFGVNGAGDEVGGEMGRQRGAQGWLLVAYARLPLQSLYTLGQMGAVANAQPLSVHI